MDAVTCRAPAPRPSFAAPLHRAAALACLLALTGCAAIPGRDFPRTALPPPTQPPNPALVQPFTAAAQAHSDASGFRLVPVGVDGLLLRLELIAQAKRSLDLQYYIFHADESGHLISEALSHAAERGVQVRILVDDAEAVAGDEQLFALAAQPNVQMRIFNPWRYRGHSLIARSVEFAFSAGRLDYRMHNKLFIADGAVALIGGRNIGDQYFQTDPDSQYADEDAFVAGPVLQGLAQKFEQFWASELAVPVDALHRSDRHGGRRLARERTPPRKAATAGLHYEEKLAAGEPLHGILSGELALAWAPVEVIADSPDKQKVVDGQRVGSLLFKPLAQVIRDTHSELTMITPYLIPTRGELHLLQDVRAGGARVRILTNSLEATDDAAAHAGYTHYRVPLLESGVELYEIRAHIESTRGSGQSSRISSYGNYGLHAKLLAFDRAAVFLGSMNYDQRSRLLNTEIGLIIHSGELAEQVVRRFTAMTQPQGAYAVSLQPTQPGGKPRLAWSTVSNGQPVTYRTEPARSGWQRFKARLLALLPLDREL